MRLYVRFPSVLRASISAPACPLSQSVHVGHQLPGIRGVYAHATEPMQAPLLDALQERWLDSGGHW